MELQRPDYLILAALAVVLALIITGSLSEISETQNTPAESQLSIQIDPASIAVLPFVAVSSSPDDQYLAHGISETLIHQLAQVSDLRVIARTSSFSFIDTPNLDARSIGQSLGVASVLEGSVQRIGGKLRILTQMVNTETGTHVWSEQFDRDESDIFEIQDDIAKFVVEHLRQTIKTEASELPIGDVGTSNLEAYDEYLRGNRCPKPSSISIAPSISTRLLTRLG
jgi:TolB-like protein